MTECVTQRKMCADEERRSNKTIEDRKIVKNGGGEEEERSEGQRTVISSSKKLTKLKSCTTSLRAAFNALNLLGITVCNPVDAIQS